MKVSAFVGCEPAVSIGGCPKPAGLCFWVHRLEGLFERRFGARSGGSGGFMVVDGGSGCCLSSHDLSELLLLVCI